jgi:hypothetical protein
MVDTHVLGKFLKHWEVLAQKANIGTGFSGTLFKNKETNELVMSFRSTEFIDDSARDNQATNTLEIKETGFAWGQLRDMKAWYEDLQKSGGPLAGNPPFSVTGYSLGGRLATAFNLMYGGVAQVQITVNDAWLAAMQEQPPRHCCRAGAGRHRQAQPRIGAWRRLAQYRRELEPV